LHLIVDCNSQRLKDPCEFSCTRSRAQNCANSADKIIAGGELSILASAHNFARELSRSRLVAVITKNLRKLSLGRRIQKVCRVLIRCGAHPHVERRTFSERESARRIVELM
jgi:hypothetical protein